MQQLTTQQLKNRQLAQDYLKIQQNTEYLTHVVRYSPHKLKVNLVSDTVPDIKSLTLLIVQLAYLLFTCHIKSTNIFISHSLLLKQPARKDTNPEVYCQYLLEKQFLSMTEQQQNYVAKKFQRHEFSALNPMAYGRYAIHYVIRLLDMAKPQLQKLKQPFDRIPPPRQLVQFVNLQPIVRNFIQPQLNKIQHPRVVILALQQSELFRENSNLVKVMNNSLFCAIRNCKNKQVLEEVCKLQNRLLSCRSQKQSLDVNCLQVEATIEEMLRFFIKNCIITVEQSIQDMGKNDQNVNNRPTAKMQQGTSKIYALGQVEGLNTDRKYYCKVQVPQKAMRDFNSEVFNNVLFEALNNLSYSSENKMQAGGTDIKPGGVKNQFLIEFLPLKGLLSVKYLTPIELNIENTDMVMYQCNNIAYHWSNVSMELVQKSTNKQVKRKQRYLALKTMAHLHITDRPLFKFLLMMDLVMLCAKIAQPQLKKNVVRVEDYSKIQEISLKIEHLIRLFIRKVQKYYKSVSQSFSELIKNES